MDFLEKASEIFSNNVSEFQKASELYKSMLDKNFGGRFCIDGHCKTIFMVEIKFDGNNWGTTPKIFDSEDEAKWEADILRMKYPFISEFRVVARKEKEEND